MDSTPPLNLCIPWVARNVQVGEGPASVELDSLTPSSVREATPQTPTEFITMKSLRTKIAAVVLAVAAMVAAPAAANAYTPGAPDVAAGGTLTPGGTVTLSAVAFDANTTVSFTVTGENGAGITLGAVKIVRNSSPAFTATTNASGNASVAIKLPANASGSYEVAVTGLKNGATVTEVTTFAVAAAAGPGGNLPATGVDSASLMGVWIGGGVLLIGGLAVTVFAVRRQRQGV